MGTHGNFIVLPHSEIRPPAACPNIPLSHIILPDTELTSPCSILIMINIRLRSDKYQVVSHWFDSTRIWTHEVRILISQNGDPTHSAIPSGLVRLEPTGWNPGCVKPITQKLELVTSSLVTLHYSHRARIGQLSVRILWLSGISCHGAIGTTSHWRNTMNAHCHKSVPILIWP